MKIVRAYSGGLDTLGQLSWIKESNGNTGEGNVQVRFERTTAALPPESRLSAVTP